MKQFKTKEARVLPVRLEEVDPPGIISHLLYVDLYTNEEAFRRGLDKSDEVASAGVEAFHPASRERSFAVSEWLAGDNCWKESVKSATQGCAPGEATGVLSADGETCTFEDGTVINFVDPVDPKAGSNGIEWDFTIVRGGKECASQ